MAHMIRSAQRHDLRAITEIYNEAVLAKTCTCDQKVQTESEREGWLLQHLHNAAFPLYVCVGDGGAVLGYAYLSAYRGGRPAVNRVCEVSYYVSFAHQGRGVGKALLGHCIAQAKERGFTHALAILMGCNERSIALLSSFGFAQWGAIPRCVLVEGALYDHLYYGRVL